MFNPQLDILDNYKIERGKIEIKENFSGITWTPVSMIDLKKGDIFRAFDSTGLQVIHKNKKNEFMATSDGYVDKLLKIATVNISQ